ncbi:unnamed protein product [Trichogramma brassicae]|uniref:Uncharacterized protein n=1 Tax=Trichogramma brassicae TaxID=86971 RepID=A0A6H5I2B6_9HYME|nr:unnamed protein product [Trichogramma brassicae]
MVIPQPTRCIRREQQAIKSTSARYKYRPLYMCVIMRMTQQAYATANLVTSRTLQSRVFFFFFTATRFIPIRKLNNMNGFTYADVAWQTTLPALLYVSTNPAAAADQILSVFCNGSRRKEGERKRETISLELSCVSTRLNRFKMQCKKEHTIALPFANERASVRAAAAAAAAAASPAAIQNGPLCIGSATISKMSMGAMAFGLSLASLYIQTMSVIQKQNLEISLRMVCNFWHTCRYKVKQQRQEQRHTRTKTLCCNARSIIKAIILRRLFECVVGETELLGEKRRNTGTEHTALVHAIGFGSLLRDNIHTRPLYKLELLDVVYVDPGRSWTDLQPKRTYVTDEARRVYYRKIMIQVASVHLMVVTMIFRHFLRNTYHSKQAEQSQTTCLRSKSELCSQWPFVTSTPLETVVKHYFSGDPIELLCYICVFSVHPSSTLRGD